jgi:protease-4
MSAEDKVAAKRWLDGLWQIFRNDILSARKLEAAAFDAYVNDPNAALRAANGDAARAAVDAGLIDGLKSHQEFRDYMIDIVGVSEDKPDSFANIDHLAYVTAMRNANLVSEPKPAVAVIVASGNIVDGEAEAGTIGSTTLTELIRQAANDENIEAIVLRVDSGGGSMFASEVIFDQLQVVRQQGKPVVASMGSLAASGGYYISLPAEEIWAAESTISGSIGVGAVMPTFQRSLAQLGVTVDGFGTTPLAGQMSPVRELGPEARELIDLSIRSAYDVFIGKVAEARKMDVAKVDEIAQGRVWIGTDALEIGLVDKIGGLDDAVASAASRAGLGDGAYEVQYVERELSFAEQVLLQYARLFRMLLSFTNADSHGLKSLFKQVSGAFENELALLDIWNDPRGIYYQCFCELR